MSALIQLRASAMPLALRCGGSAVPSKIRLNTSCAPADAGSAAHYVLKTLPASGRVDWSLVDVAAQLYQIDPKEISVLVALGARMWPELAPSFPNAIAEQRLVSLIYTERGSWELSGSPDFVTIGETIARGGDWKCGRKDTDYSQQMMGYNALLLLNNPGLLESHMSLIWIRTGEVETYSMTRAQLEQWLTRVESTVINWDGVLRPSDDYCHHCPRSHECDASNALARRNVAAIVDCSLDSPEASLDTMSAEEKIGFYKKAKAVDIFLKGFLAALKTEALERGPIATDECSLEISEELQRDIDTKNAWPVLQSMLTDDEMVKVVDVRVSRAEKIISAKAGRGNGAKSVREFKQKLEDAGAVSYDTIEKMVLRRK